MRIENNNLILDNELTDEVLEEFIQFTKDNQFKSVIINTNNISSIILQQIFCLSKTKDIVCNDNFMAKFFDNISFEDI